MGGLFYTPYKKMILEFLLWHSGLRIQLQWLGLLWRCRFNPQPSTTGYRMWHCHSCGTGCSCGLDSIPGPRTSICHKCGHNFFFLMYQQRSPRKFQKYTIVIRPVIFKQKFEVFCRGYLRGERNTKSIVIKKEEEI